MIAQPHTKEPTYAERMEAAYMAGRAAKRDGKPLARCPHKPDTPAHDEWVTGWREAEVAEALS
jgi:ribosome modulation factor